MRSIKKHSILFIILQLQICGCQIKSNKDSISGTYQSCYIACTTVKINPDLTFRLELNGDLFNGENSEGYLIPLGKNSYLANSKIQYFVPEEYKKNRNNLIISLADENNERLGFASVLLNDKDTLFTADSLGYLIIPKIKLSKIKVNFIGSGNSYKIKDPDVDSVFIRHFSNPGKIIITNEKWIIKNDSLFFPGSSGIGKLNK